MSKKLAIITGGCSGLGYATAKLLVKNNYFVVMCDLYEDESAICIKELGGQNNACFYQCDVTKVERCQEVVDIIAKKYGEIHVLVCSAGMGILGSILTKKGQAGMEGQDAFISDDHSKAFMKILNVNVIGTYNFCRACAFHMIKNKPYGPQNERGVMILVSSNSATEGQNGQIMYGSSKAAVNGMTLPMARDLGKFGIRCTTIAPGPIVTPMSQGFSDKTRDALIRDSSFGRLGQADEFADAALMVINSGYMTGTVVRLDGGIRLPKQ